MIRLQPTCIRSSFRKLLLIQKQVKLKLKNSPVWLIMNRLLVEGNFYGGLVQGIGLALTEDFEDLNHDTSLKNCGIPYPNDAPDDIELHFNETYRPSGPYGAAGCGEAPLDAPHPAILNAIYNATGARITRVPARPEKVLAALKELEK